MVETLNPLDSTRYWPSDEGTVGLLLIAVPTRIECLARSVLTPGVNIPLVKIHTEPFHKRPRRCLHRGDIPGVNSILRDPYCAQP